MFWGSASPPTPWALSGPNSATAAARPCPAGCYSPPLIPVTAPLKHPARPFAPKSRASLGPCLPLAVLAARSNGQGHVSGMTPLCGGATSMSGLGTASCCCLEGNGFCLGTSSDLCSPERVFRCFDPCKRQTQWQTPVLQRSPIEVGHAALTAAQQNLPEPYGPSQTAAIPSVVLAFPRAGAVRQWALQGRGCVAVPPPCPLEADLSQRVVPCTGYSKPGSCGEEAARTGREDKAIGSISTDEEQSSDESDEAESPADQGGWGCSTNLHPSWPWPFLLLCGSYG